MIKSGFHDPVFFYPKFKSQFWISIVFNLKIFEFEHHFNQTNLTHFTFDFHKKTKRQFVQNDFDIL